MGIQIVIVEFAGFDFDSLARGLRGRGQQEVDPGPASGRGQLGLVLREFDGPVVATAAAAALLDRRLTGRRRLLVVVLTPAEVDQL